MVMGLVVLDLACGSKGLRSSRRGCCQGLQLVVCLWLCVFDCLWLCVCDCVFVVVVVALCL